MARTRTDATNSDAPELAFPRPTPWANALLGLFLLALLLRLWTLVRLQHSPLGDYLVVDSEFYWRWAARILAGDWIGQRAFFFGPLYPYALAALRGVVGSSIPHVLVVQVVLGSISVCLLTDAARRLTSTGPALVVGALLAVNRQANFLDAQILMESLLFTLQSILLWIVVARRPAGGGLRWAFGCGLLIGVMALGRATALALLLPLGGYLATQLGPGRAVRATLLAGLAAAVLGAPVAIRHWVLLHEWIPYTYNSGFNLYVGNGPGSDGASVSIIPQYETDPDDDPEGGPDLDGRSYLAVTRGLQLSPAESSRWWTRAALDWMGAHPGHAVMHFLRKLGMVFNHRELSQVSSVDEYEHLLGPIGLPMAGTFLPLGLLGIAGLPFAWRGEPRLRFLVAALATTAAMFALFFVTDRYRLHLLPLLALLGAVTIHELTGAIRARSPRTLAAFVGMFAIAAGTMFLPLVPPVANHIAWLSARTLGNAWLQRGSAAPALTAYDEAMRIESLGTMPGMDTQSASEIRTNIYQNRATALSMLGRHAESAAMLEAAMELAPQSVVIRRSLAEELALSGRPADARRAYADAGIGVADAERQLLRRAAEADARNDRETERVAVVAAEALVPGDESAAVPLVRLHLESGNVDDAEAVLERARLAGLDRSVYVAHAAWIAFARRDTAGARRLVASIPPTGLADPRVAGTFQLMNRAAATR